MPDRQQLEMAIAAQEGLRGIVPDEVVDAAIGAIRQQLSSIDRSTRRRRQATVVFADVSGFTAMSEQMDAELVADAMNRIWALVDAAIVEHGGRVDKHIGDAVMATWGVEGTREDDPERAVRAGLALQDALRTLPAAGRARVAMRVGISTGPVVFGSVGTTTESTAIGDTVNTASRLENAAPIGGVLISHGTYRHVRGVFDVEALEPLKVKGKVDPLQVYVVLRAKPQALRIPTRGVEGIETRMVGRDAELDTLRDAFLAVVEDRRPRIVTVVGDAGVGKSRLKYEFENWVELLPERVAVFAGRAMPSRPNASLGLLRDVIGRRFDVSDGDAPAALAAKIRSGFSNWLGRDAADVAAHWLGFDLSASPAVQRLLGPAFSAVARSHLLRYFTGVAADQPVLILLEDLHWADDESLDLIDELAERLAPAPVLITAFARPSLFERRAEARFGGQAAMRIDLAPLSTDATGALAREVLKGAGVAPVELVDLIVERTEGNPFYVEELVKMLIDDGVIDTEAGDGTWRIDLGRVDPAHIPATLTGVLQARLDSLAAIERLTLQRASVVGRVFWDAAVSALGSGASEGEADDAIKSALEATRRRELVLRNERSAFDETIEFTFKHALLRDVTYEMVLLRDRCPLHALAASWIESHAGERASEYRELIAGHLRLAGNLVAAAEQLGLAGEALLSRGNSVGARRCLDEALDLWAAAGLEPPATALIALGDSCWVTSDFEGAAVALGRALNTNLTPEDRARALFLSSWVVFERGDLAGQRLLLDQALPVAETCGGSTLNRTLVALAWWEMNDGDPDEARRLGERARRQAEEAGMAIDTSRALQVLASIAESAGDLDEAERLAHALLEIADAMGHLHAQILATELLGTIATRRGEASGATEQYLAAKVHLDDAMVLSRRLGHRALECNILLGLARVCVRVGDDLGARGHMHDALRIAIGISADTRLLECLAVEADRRLAAGDPAGALSLLGTVRSHPAKVALVDQLADRTLSRCALSADEVAIGLARGAGVDLEAAVGSVLADLSSTR